MRKSKTDIGTVPSTTCKPIRRKDRSNEPDPSRSRSEGQRIRCLHGRQSWIHVFGESGIGIGGCKVEGWELECAELYCDGWDWMGPSSWRW